MATTWNSSGIVAVEAAPQRESSIPWYLWCVVLAVTSVTIGGHWDVSWHRSIGRDTFWTPAHMAIYACGVLAAISCGYLVFHTTFRKPANLVASSVSVFGFRAPLGAFIASWGGIAMLTSAPFDNWWHASFGLDVAIVSPPHMVLGVGILAVAIGALLLLVSSMNRAAGDAHTRLRWMYLLLGGVILALHCVLLSEYTNGSQMHGPAFYRALSLAVPIILVGLSRASGYRWGATIVAAIYTAWVLGQLWLLPLFPATPKLGPVFTNITHMVPLEFPALIVVPAIALDFLLNRYANKNKWALAAMLGTAYLGVLLAVHWPLGDFLISPAARNWVFGQNYFPYMQSPSEYHFNWEFVDLAPTTGLFLYGLGIALVTSIVGSRIGLAAGDALRGLRR